MNKSPDHVLQTLSKCPSRYNDQRNTSIQVPVIYFLKIYNMNCRL